MGALPYELLSAFEPSLNLPAERMMNWPETAFFEPELLLYMLRGEQTLHIEGDLMLWEKIAQAPLPSDFLPGPAPDFRSNFSRGRYMESIRRLRRHIREGDCYEINLSQAFRSEYQLESPAAVFSALVQRNPVPFASFFRWEDNYLLAASPERFLQRQGQRLLTQPIKGTAPRGDSPETDRALAEQLRRSEKEQAENVMIVDLCRNDLHRVCRPRSVQVPQLFELQSFPTVHQLVSTVTGELDAGFSAYDAIRAAFPPGSMTGAPKVKTMELIAHYEALQRGLYAGSVGYIEAGGDFDFNVVIRALQYDAALKQLCYQVGGAITWASDPALEYEETLVKAAAIRRIWQKQ